MNGSVQTPFKPSKANSSARRKSGEAASAQPDQATPRQNSGGRSTAKPDQEAASRTSGNRAAMQPHKAEESRKSGDPAFAQPGEATAASKSASSRMGQAKPTDDGNIRLAVAAAGRAETGGDAALRRAKRIETISASASDTTQTSIAVASAIAAVPGTTRTQASGNSRTERAKNARRDDEHRPARAPSKLAQIEALLRRDGGAAIADLMAATGWQRHSVHGVLSGTFKTKLGLVLTRTQASDGTSVYAIKSPA